MKCVVPGCDTDDDVVSYTSVFFVKFPSDPIVQQQWFSQLELTDSCLMRAMLNGEAKICSCHFAEDCFGQHPVYGYRFLLPKALPTILPLSKVAEEVIDASESETPPDYYFVYLNDSAEPAIIDRTAIEEVADATEQEVIEGLSPLEAPRELIMKEVIEQPEDEEAAEEVDEEESVEEIGIEYANGKYYFLKLDEDPTDAPETNATQLSHVESKTDVKHETTNAVEQCTETASDALPAVELSVCEDSRSDQLSEELASFSDDDERALVRETTPYMTEDGHLEENIEMSSEERLDEEIQSNHDQYRTDTEEEDHDSERQSDGQQDEEYLEDSDRGTVMSETDFVVERDDCEDGEHGPVETLDDVSIIDDNSYTKTKTKRKDRFFCNDCSKGFPFKSQMDRHILVHTKEKKFICEVCEKGFSQKINLDVHMRVHTGEQPDKKYTCQICLRKCSRISELEAHLSTHMKHFPHVCPVCTQRFSELTSLYTHFRADHRDVMSHPELIEVLSQNENAMLISGQEPDDIRHNDGRYECVVCGKVYRSQQMLSRHKRKMHVKIFRCPHCPRKYAYKSLLTKHLPTHTLEKPFPCPHCPLSYTQRVNLKCHIGRKHPHMLQELHIEKTVRSMVPDENEGSDQYEETAAVRAYECDQCGKRFSRKPTLLVHMAAHANGDEPATYDCDLCGLSLAGHTALQRHRWRLHGAQTKGTKTITSLELRNVTIVPTENDYYVEIEDEMDTIHEEYVNED
uniref:Zinc finger protein n=1 Tax=Anopheles dirus TaxID=7168 RepID=A0A182NIU7_9DIPT